MSALAIAAWTALSAIGFAGMMNHAATPGGAGRAPEQALTPQGDFSHVLSVGTHGSVQRSMLALWFSYDRRILAQA
jgi:hypothetical protein